MNTRILTLLIIAALFTGCKKDGGVGPQTTKDDAAFTVYEGVFLDALWKQYPDWAAREGYHKYDSLLVVPSNKNRDKLLDFDKSQLDSIDHYPSEQLSQSNRIDYYIIQNQLQYSQWQISVLKQYQWDPSQYNVTGAFANILTGHYAPLTKRLRNLYQKMSFVPEYYKEAEKQIKNPVVELTTLAEDQLTGGASVFEKDFPDSLNKSNIPEAEKKLMLDRATASAEAIKGFAAWLKTMKNDHPRSFRLGKEFYDDKFKYVLQSQYTTQQIYNSAMERKKHVQREMASLGKKLWPKYFGTKEMPKDSLDMLSQLIDTISSQHTTVADFQATIENQIPKLTSFVRSNDMVTINASNQLIVRREPAYMAGVSEASISAPGPYDKDGNTYYNVGSLANYTPEKAEGILHEYDNYTLQLLDMHEVMPGHYLQSTYANQSESLIKNVFANSAMVEGWAVYGEQMMIDNGYNSAQPEMKLMWYKWHLRSVCNTIIDYGVHAGGMTQADVMKLLTHEAFEQQAEAESKWKRLTETSVQLDCYYTGYKEIMDLRETWKKDQADKYTLKDFNEKFLSYGNAPVKYIKEAMMKKQTVSKVAN